MASNEQEAGPYQCFFTKEALDQSLEAAHERASQTLREHGLRVLPTEPRPLNLKESCDLVVFYAQKLPDLCRLCAAPPEVLWTALIFFKRFFAASSPMEFDPLTMMFTCVHVACKVEEFRNLTLDKLLEAGGFGEQMRPRVVDLELELLQALDFELHVEPKVRPSLRVLGQELQARSNIADLEEAIDRAEDLVLQLCASTNAVLQWPVSVLIAVAWEVALEEAVAEKSSPVCSLLLDNFTEERHKVELRNMFQEAAQAFKQLSYKVELNREAMQEIAKASRKCQKAFERIREEHKQRHEARCNERKRRRNDAKTPNFTDIEALKRKAQALRGDARPGLQEPTSQSHKVRMFQNFPKRHVPSTRLQAALESSTQEIVLRVSFSFALSQEDLQLSGAEDDGVSSPALSKVSASRKELQDLAQRGTERSNTFHLPVTESYLNTKNVRIDRKKTERNLKGVRGKLDDFLQSSFSEYLVAVIIVVNSAMFGVQADFAVKHPFEDAPAVFGYINLAFNIFFIAELSLRLAAYGYTFVSCWNPDFKWNVLDTALVSLSLFEEVYGRISVDDDGGRHLDMTSARVMRLLRLVRVIRVFRVLRFFSDLRIMVMGIMGSFKALFWALLLLSIIIYVTGIIILQFVADAAANQHVVMAPGPEFEGNAMFNSLERCCFTLFLCISGGISWVEVVEPLEEVNGPILVPLLSLYVAFAVFCVLNIVTGVFVERSTSMRAMDEENMMFDEIESRKKWLREIRHLFKEADKDGSGQVEWQEFELVMADFQAQTAMKNLGFDTSRVSPQVLWHLIDYDNSGQIDIEEFAEALMKLHGSANAIDIARLRHDTRRSFNQ
ncbi:CCNH [Symbiodinium natans]|uniref:CCNH protein n=1 Tax=Symbiodinium natans TaxID=878477 RepID=A0A812RF14_9DINO|nr:CCNH [Symbiodinium natans]